MLIQNNKKSVQKNIPSEQEIKDTAQKYFDMIFYDIPLSKVFPPFSKIQELVEKQREYGTYGFFTNDRYYPISEDVRKNFQLALRDIYINVKSQFRPTVFIPGETYNVKEFAMGLDSCRGGAKKAFLKENSEGYWPGRDKEKVTEEQIQVLIGMCGEIESIWNCFNKIAEPYDIKSKELSYKQNDVASNNVFDKMAAKKVSQLQDSFKIDIKWGASPITVVKEYSKDTTLSMYDINSFMRG